MIIGHLCFPLVYRSELPLKHLSVLKEVALSLERIYFSQSAGLFNFFKDGIQEHFL